MIPSDLSVPLAQQIPLLPIWLALIGGLIAAIVCWRICPRSALLVLLALLLLAVATLLGTSINYQLLRVGRIQHWTTRETGFYFMGAGVILNLVRAAGYGLLFAAVFIGRRPDRFPSAGSAYPPPLPPPAL